MLIFQGVDLLIRDSGGFPVGCYSGIVITDRKVAQFTFVDHEMTVWNGTIRRFFMIAWGSEMAVSKVNQ